MRDRGRWTSSASEVGYMMKDVRPSACKLQMHSADRQIHRRHLDVDRRIEKRQPKNRNSLISNPIRRVWWVPGPGARRLEARRRGAGEAVIVLFAGLEPARAGTGKKSGTLRIGFEIEFLDFGCALLDPPAEVRMSSMSLLVWPKWPCNLRTRSPAGRRPSSCGRLRCGSGRRPPAFGVLAHLPTSWIASTAMFGDTIMTRARRARCTRSSKRS